jgi:phosphoserine phosphatase
MMHSADGLQEAHMTIGLFLDVDNTLTAGFIQKHYAEMIGVGADYLTLEELYGTAKIKSEEFGDRIIELFNRTIFNEQFAYDNFSKIRLRDSARPLLRTQSPSIKIYFVSAGPNYYVRKLAEEIGIRNENVLCSEYRFDGEGKLAECDAVTPEQKYDFVKVNADGHDLTIGVGDDDIHDSPFLNICDIGVMTPKYGHAGEAPSENHLCAPRLSLILSLVTNFDRKLRTGAADYARQISRKP